MTLKLILELVLYCLLFTALVRYAVKGGPLDGLYFYPKAVQERVYELGLTDRETVARKRKAFMIPFVLIMAIALLLIIGVWNQVRDYKTAYFQSLFFLEGMNWYDGIVIDRLWVGNDPFWIIPGTEDIPFVQTWNQVLRKRIIYTIVYAFVALITAGLVVLLFH